MSTIIQEAAQRQPDVSKNAFYLAVCDIDRGDQGRIAFVEAEKGRRVAEWVDAVAMWLVEHGRCPMNITDAGWWARELDDLVQAGLVERSRNRQVPASLLAPTRTSVLDRGGKHDSGTRARVAAPPTTPPSPTTAVVVRAVLPPASATAAVGNAAPRPAPVAGARVAAFPDEMLVPEVLRGSIPDLNGIGPHPVRTLGAWNRMDEPDRWLAVYTLVGALSQEVGPMMLEVVIAYISAERHRRADPMAQGVSDLLMSLDPKREANRFAELVEARVFAESDTASSNNTPSSDGES